MNRLLFLLLSFNFIGASLLANPTEIFDAAFGFSYVSCDASGVTIAFEDQSTDEGITGWAWEFSDGQMSSAQNPTITVSSSQQLGARLTITLGDGSTLSTTQTLDVVLMEEVQLPNSLLLCPGGAIPINPRNNPDYAYSWSPTTGLTDPNAANPLASPDETTTYTVTITDDSGSGVCEQVKSVTVTVPPEIPFELEEDYTTCEDEVTLTVDTDVTNTINWFDVGGNKIGEGESVTIALESARSVFFVEIIDEPGCSVKDAIVITKGEVPTVVAEPNNPSCANANTGSATAIANGGTAPYNYNWSNGQSGVTINDVEPGDYTVTVTDANGCTAESTVTVAQSGEVSVSASSPNPVCDGETSGEATAVGTGGVGPYTYNWNTGQVGGTVNGLPAGTYVVTTTDANGCTAETSVDVAGNPPINTTTATTNETTPDANDGTATVTPGGGTPEYTYMWSTGATTQEVDGLAPGTYTVTVTDANGCTAVTTVTIEAAKSVSVSLQTTPPDCGGDCTGTITPTVTGAVGELTYLWSDGSMADSRSDLCAGDYAVTVTDSEGTSNETSTSITEPSPIQTAINSSAAPACTGDATGTASATGSGGTAPYTFMWSDGSTTQDISDLAAGDYTVTITDANGCTQEDMITISDPPPVTALSAADFDPCASDNNMVALNGSSNVNNIATWSWTLSDGTMLDGQNPTFPVDGPADLTATLTVTTEDGCTATSPASAISINEFMPQALEEMKMVCEGFSTGLNPDPNTEYTYTWSPAEGLNDPNSPNPVVTGDGSGASTTYSVIISNGTCEATDEIEVMSPLAIDLTAQGDTSLCETMDVGINASGANFTSLEWSDDPNFGNILGTDGDLTVMPELTTTYYVRVTDDAGCVKTDQVTIDNNSLAVGVTPEATVCSSDETNLQDQIVNQNPNQILTYDWMDPDNVITGDSNTGSPTVNATENTVLNVTISNEAGCELNEDISIEVVNIEDADASASPAEFIQGGETQLNASGPSGATFTWSPATGLDNPNIANPTANPEETTTYTVTIETPEGCATTRTVTVTVTPASCEEPFVFFPNAFTPNGDGENDMLFLRGNSITTMYFAIYNRFGERVFESRNLNSGWDGTFQGEPVCPDVYGFYLEATCVNGDNFFKQGNVTVLK